MSVKSFQVNIVDRPDWDTKEMRANGRLVDGMGQPAVCYSCRVLYYSGIFRLRLLRRGPRAAPLQRLRIH